MLDGQRDATFVVVDSGRLGGTPPQATLNLLSNLRRSQKPVSPLWIDECVRRGTLVDFEQFLIRSSSTVPPTMRQPTGEKPTDTEVPYKRGKKPTDTEAPYKHASTPLALGVTATFERKRRLSQSEVHPADEVVRPIGIIRKAVDPRVRPRPSPERQASNPEISTRPATSISRPIPTTHSFNTFGGKRHLSRSSVYDRPDATTLDLPANRIDLGAIKDDLHKVANGPSQVPPQGVNMISHPVRSNKLSFPNAAAANLTFPQPTRAYRPDTPPLPPNLSTSIGIPPSHDLARGSMVGPEMPQCLGPATSSSPQPRPEAPRPQSSADDDYISELSSPPSSEVSACKSSLDDEATPQNQSGDSSASFRPTILRSTQARLDELVNELDKWLNTEPVETAFMFLKSLDVKVSPLLEY
jgi:hypothetical protein